MSEQATRPKLPPTRPVAWWRLICRALLMSAACLSLAGLAGAAWLMFDAWWPHVAPTFAEQAPALDGTAPDFSLRDLDGKVFHLSEHLGSHLIVIEFGSCTCLQCVLTGLDKRETLARRFQQRAEFLFVYCHEAHPDTGFGTIVVTQGPAPPQTYTWQQRADRARWFQAQQKMNRHVLIDEDGERSVQNLYGGRDNQMIVVDSHGNIALKLPQANTRRLEEFLQQTLTTVGRERQEAVSRTAATAAVTIRSHSEVRSTARALRSHERTSDPKAVERRIERAVGAPPVASANRWICQGNNHVS
jgi:hypothetical protein